MIDVILWVLFVATCEACDRHNAFTARWRGETVEDPWHVDDPRWTPLDRYLGWYEHVADPWECHEDAVGCIDCQPTELGSIA